MLENLVRNELIHATVSNWVVLEAMKVYKKEMMNLTSKENGFHNFHFITAKMTQEQLKKFDVEDIMKQIIIIAPHLWRLMETLHAANTRINHQRAWTQKKSKKVTIRHGERNREDAHKRMGPQVGPEGDIEMADIQTVWDRDSEPDDKEEFWKTIDNDEFELIGEEDDEPEDIQEQAKT